MDVSGLLTLFADGGVVALLVGLFVYQTKQYKDMLDKETARHTEAEIALKDVIERNTSAIIALANRLEVNNK